MGRAMRKVPWLAVALAAAVVCCSASEGSTDESLAKLLTIKQVADETYLNSAPRSSGGQDVKMLGDNAEMTTYEAQAEHDASDTAGILHAERLLSTIALENDYAANRYFSLGENKQLDKDWPSMEVTNPKDVS